ncbi:MAG: O-antigen ligase family protein [Clostridium sp.]|uniref:O-antigen ligase family protein n=1 Tax=Clostridium sp. TaxID=1506 RepID=UPI003F403D72
MKEKIMGLVNKDEFDIALIIVFTFATIGSKSINIRGNIIYVEFIAIISIYLVVKEVLYAKRNFKEYKEDLIKYKMIVYPVLGLVISYIVYGSVLNPRSSYFLLNKMYPYIFLIVIFLRFSRIEKEKIQKYVNLISEIFIIAGVLGIIMYLMKYTNGAFSLDKIMEFQTFNESIDLYGEIRFYWLLSHKSRYTMYCLIGSIFILNSELKKQVKVSGLVLMTINTLMSNSMIGIMIYMIVVFVGIMDKLDIISKLFGIAKKNKKITIGALIFSIVIGFSGMVIVSKQRDLSTLGARTFIWEAGIQNVKDNPKGIVEMPSNNWIKAEFEGDEYYFTNAHNMYINEFLEGGVILGIMYIGVALILCIYYFKSKDIVFSLFLIMFIGLYSNFESINTREMPYIVFFTFGIMFWFKKRKEVVENGEDDREKIIHNHMHV